MLQGLIAIATATIVVGSQVGTVSQAIADLPPRPIQASLSCRDQNWEAANLLVLENSRVHRALLPFAEKMLADAAANGSFVTIVSAYRDCAQQTSLRLAACGSGDYNLLQKPADLCLPPTESPGRSLHGEGLALDLGCVGYGQFLGSNCYAWMKQNAARYHLFEHPLEPWHWSTAGY